MAKTEGSKDCEGIQSLWRLGLNQPSKVVDWLLNAAKHEIDELPPLPIPPGNFTLGYPSLATSNDVSQNSAIWKSKSKDQVSVEMATEKENWMSRSEGDKQGSNECSVGTLLRSWCVLLETQPYFPSHVAAMEMDPRQINHFQMLSSSSSQNLLTTNSLINPSQQLMSQSGKPFSLGRMTAPKLLHSPNNSESHSHRGQDFPSK
ncbi:hypothetical protein SESBI_44681 [Sesbania bispinosa]|nr:hypothetical protein SESBI_44681 [Sesbania bispinosa]